MIYTASFKNPIHGTYDTIDTDKIGMILLNNTIVNSIDKQYEINYSLSFIDEKVRITGDFSKNKDISIKETFFLDLDPQEFTDEMANAMHERRLPDNSDIIKDAKNIIVSRFSDIFLQKNIVLKNARYLSFGYIKSLGDKIGTFEYVKYLNEDSLIKLDDSLSSLDLTKVDDLSIEFIIGNYKYEYDVKYQEDGIFEFTNEIKSLTDKQYDIEPRSNFKTLEQLFENRKKLISFESIVDNTNIDEFFDLF